MRERRRNRPVALSVAAGVNVYVAGDTTDGGDAFTASWRSGLGRDPAAAGVRLWPSVSLGVRR